MPLEVAAGRSDVRIVVTDRADGDLAVGLDPGELAPRRRAVRDAPWSWLRQVHGPGVVVVGDSPVEGVEADALVTDRPGAVLAVHAADCAPIALVSQEGPIGVVHAGWRGIVAGVVPAAVGAMADLGARRIDAWVGPCIRPGCYEFGADDLALVESLLGPSVRGETTTGAPALDLPAAVRLALECAGVRLAGEAGSCTACDDRWYSHRARAEDGRHALVAWIEP